jgi:hypothetical protein
VIAVPALLCLIALLGVLVLRQAHHPGEVRGLDRRLIVVASAAGLVGLALALGQLVALTRP